MMTLQQAATLTHARFNSARGASRIHGEGYFARRAILKGEVIMRGFGSRGYNHGCAPNVSDGPQWTGGWQDVHAARDIAAGEELLLDYTRHSGRFNESWRCVCPACNPAAG